MGARQLPALVRSWLESLSSASCWPMASGDRKQDECVKVEAIRGSCEVNLGGKKCTPVMVRVTAVPRPWSRTAAVDVVAVLNVSSSSMKGKMAEMKEAMEVVIDKLGPDNRLSLVLLDDKHRVDDDLNHVASQQGRDAASTRISNWLSTIKTRCDVFHSESVAAALCQADKILRERSAAAGHKRLGCIMLLSGGEGKDISTVTCEELNSPVHIFGLGADHEARCFRCVADKNAGTYSFIHSKAKITDAFEAFIGGLTSVAATSVKTSLEVQAGWSIVVAGEEVQAHNIGTADVLCAGERKSFMVYLTRSSDAALPVPSEKLLTVKCRYNPPQLAGWLPPADKEMATTVAYDTLLAMESNSEAVAAELARIKLLREVIAMADGDEAAAAAANLNGVVQDLQQVWESIKGYPECQGADTTALSKLDKDVAEMTKLEEAEAGRPYMLSWLSCHQLQRATAVAHHSCAYFKVQPAPTASPSSRGMAWGSCPCLALCGVVLFVFLVMLLLRLWPPADQIMPPSHNGTALDIGKHPSWPAMATNLADIVETTKQDKITSFFTEQHASSQDMNQQIDRYLYMAIVYTAVLRARYDGTAPGIVSDDKAVRRQAELYLHSMLKRTKHALPISVTNDASLEHVTGEMSHYLYSTIVQANVLVTLLPSPPTPTPDDDKDNKDKKIKELQDVVDGKDEKVKELQDVVDGKDEKIKELQDVVDGKDEKIKEMGKLIAELRIEITTLRVEKDSCCQKATKCGNRVRELGGTVDDDDDKYVVVDRRTTVYYDQVQEIPSHK